MSSDFLNERIVRKVEKCQRVQVLDGGDESRGLRGTEVGGPGHLQRQAEVEVPQPRQPAHVADQDVPGQSEMGTVVT